MGITVAWFNDDKDILHFKIEGRWTWQELHEANGVASQLRAERPGIMVDGLVDVSKASAPPAHGISNIRKAMSGANELNGVSVITGGSLFMEALIDTFLKVYRPYAKLMATARSVDEALEIIQKHRIRRGQVSVASTAASAPATVDNLSTNPALKDPASPSNTE